MLSTYILEKKHHLNLVFCSANEGQVHRGAFGYGQVYCFHKSDLIIKLLVKWKAAWKTAIIFVPSWHTQYCQLTLRPI